MVKLAADLAAFNNVDPETTFTALQRGVAGSTRGLKPLGIIIDSTAIKAEALADGIVKPTKDRPRSTPPRPPCSPTPSRSARRSRSTARTAT
jgi:hypothetical protein